VVESAPATPAYWRYTDAEAFMDRVKNGMPPVIVCCACNGGIQGKEANENLPETADEIAESVHEAYLAGASMVHVHARDPSNLTRSAATRDAWVEVNTKIRRRCPEIIINNSTGGGPGMTMDERLACLDAGPEVASLNLSPEMVRFTLKERTTPLACPRPALVFDECVPWSYHEIRRFAAAFVERGIKPELETYHPGGAWVLKYLISEQLIRPPYWVQTVMGYQTSSYPTVDNVLQMLRDFPDETVWLCSGIGPFQLAMTTLALLVGGHVRVGLEDNLYYRRGEPAKSNAQLVERVVRIAGDLNRTIATPAQARAILGLPALAGTT